MNEKTSYWTRFIQIIFLVAPIASGIYGVAEHEQYGLGYAACGFIAAGLGLIAAALLILVLGILIGMFAPRAYRRYDGKGK